MSVCEETRQRICRKGYLNQKGGVMLVDAGRQQLSLLDTPQSDAKRQRSEKLMGVMGELNQNMGRGTVKLGMPSPGAARHLCCAHRTPFWRTQWSDIPRLR
ncbi:DUF4113 domain-containing protein [Halomonas sp. DQ26W]|uniref:DUF4113 domain-containing protein n=1 Tax=Halomonas sp. DQ26W TaxID=2282311 RepID=UPI000DF767E2|nr:DUF4113 domain-containing protein [Halomonas sp. DQ26W]RDB43443.1 DUF4113 domain-containing protein [Halomonas sp. DQ26W]